VSAGNDVRGDRPAAPPPQPFFHSRWVPLPEHVRDLGPDAGLSPGFRAAGVACGIKQSGNPDLGLLVCDSENPVSAARFADTGTPAAPVLLGRERCSLSSLRAVLANSGCANAATGQRGLEDAAKTQGAAAMALGVQPSEVVLGSTGGISQYLPVDRMLGGIRDAATRLDRAGDVAFQHAIQTTDAFEKRACLEVRLPAGAVRLTAQCKGAGMISPRFATMLCFVQTDAALARETADLLLGVCLKRSFDRCSVDGQLSTNDTAVLMCSGESGVWVNPESEEERLFGEALDALLRQLAILMVRDGEGAARIARVVVRGGSGMVGSGPGMVGSDPGGNGGGGCPDLVEAAARAVANSPLVKAALHGKDPNWGRIVQAVGGALGGWGPHPFPLALDISIEGVQVCSAGAAVLSEEELRDALGDALEREEVEYEIALPGEGAETEVFFSDLSHEYVTINADYTT
jgi:glutamate N-acetyltransferase / amino-acid N-acetyltransferase